MRGLFPRFLRALGFVVSAGLGAAVAAQTSVTFNPSKDNTLYQSDLGDVSNGEGVDLFAGRTDRAEVRRAVVRFDVSSIPPGSVVTSASLRMRVNRARSGTFTSTLHRMLADWGEGSSNATQNPGQGAPATTGDATWLHRFYPAQPWTAPGGDFVATPSASAPIGSQNGFYVWPSGSSTIADVQSWVDNPATNFGWIVRVDETQNTTARRFDSGEASTLANRPLLSVTYTPPASPTGACCLASGSCSVTTQFNCGQTGGTYQGDDTACVPNPCPQPTGACCQAGAVCGVVTQVQCTALGGVYQGDSTGCSPNPCAATTQVTLTAVLDNTLYETAAGELSNGAGQWLFAGTANNPPLVRRGLIAFDFSPLPTNALVLSASLELYMGFTQDPASNAVSLHKVLVSWGEGSSDASGNETGGASSTIGDATWLHRAYNTSFWTMPGGDFVAAPSASTTIGTTVGAYTWTSATMTADVQAWIATPGTNSGWLLMGNEGASRTQRGFSSSEGGTAAQRPRLTIVYTLPPTTGACCMIDGSCTLETGSVCAAMDGTYQGDGTVCDPDPCPQPSGACCLPTGICIETTAAACASQSGTYQGSGVLCSAVMCPIVLEPFVDALPIPAVAQPVSGQIGGAAHYQIAMTEFNQKLHRDLPETRVWGYGGSYPGPTIVARRGLPVTVDWINDLRDAGGNLRTTHMLNVDTCLHGPNETGQVPVAVVHLHGGHVAPHSDGYPDLAFPPGQQSPTYTYPNDQPAALIWYHDHGLGITRLNVYMGLAGGYLLRDDAEEALGLPAGEYELPLVIADRSFHPDGSLMYHHEWHDHFFGDFILVNGKVWPYLNVKRGKYRFRLLEGSNSRVYTLAFSNGMTFEQIGTDLGLLPAPVTKNSITMAPGERADIIVDFSSLDPGTEIVLTNSAPAPYPGPAGVGVVPNVMKFIVGPETGWTGPVPASLVPVPAIPEAEATQHREFVLRKMFDPECGHDMWMINDLMWDDITEFPRIGETEVWSWINRSGVVHPMHMHLVAFQVLDRQDFEIQNGEVVPVGPRFPPPPEEAGWKDTVQAHPNQITRVITRFEDFPGLFPYHCHVLEHEDHEMMRQFQVLCDSPSISGQPAALTVCLGATAMFTVSATGDVLQYAWRLDGQPLSDGTTAHGSVVSGSDAATLTITGAQAEDSGTYSCSVVNPCGEQSSSGAELTVCLGDFDCDGNVTVADIFVGLAAYFAGDPRMDWDRSGPPPTLTDFFMFFADWFVPC